MSNLKWADVAHYYLKSGITMKNVGKPSEYHKSWVAKDIMDLVLLDRGDIQLMPILRHLEDMTEGEVVEYASGVGNGIPNRGKKPHSRLVKSSMGVAILTSTVHGDPQNERYCESRDCFFDRLTPAQFIWLIAKGFDVFGLIESGQAIRKEVEGA